MAKAAGISAVFTGRAGDKVYFALKDTKLKQGMRIYNPVVNNPKTFAQAMQRMKLAPVTNLYRALKPIIDRGFEGKKYGNQSRLRYQQLALRSNSLPFITKSNTNAVPGAVVISEGSLIPISIVAEKAIGGGTAFVTDLFGFAAANTTIGLMSQALMNANTDIQQGDQLTFVRGYRYGQSFVYRSDSIIIDTTDTTAVPAWLSRDAEASNSVAILSGALAADEEFVAAAVIHSRDYSSDRHLRSTASLYPSASMKTQYNSIAQFQAAIKSYMSDAGNNDWPEEPIDGNVVVRVLPLTVSNSKFATGGLPEGGETTILAYVTPSGAVGFFLQQDRNERNPTFGKWIVYDVNGNLLTGPEGKFVGVEDAVDLDTSFHMTYDSKYGLG